MFSMKSSPFILTVFATLLFIPIQAQEKEMCITLDDLPVVSYGTNEPDFLREVTKKLIHTFDEFDIPAIGYVNERKLYKKGRLDSASIQLLELWLENGYELGNHTYSHKNYHKTSFEEYTEDIIKGEVICRQLAEKHNAEFRFFRHPYLRIGRTKSRHDSLTNFLMQHGYTEAPVTIDNEDYLFAKAYHLAYTQGDSATMKKIGQSYLRYMEEKLLYYESMSEKLWGRNIRQTLLLHANLLNADYLDDLAEIYRSHGYTFISQAKVLKDPAYDEPVSKYGDWGISWLDRWALSQGKKGEFFRGDPATPAFVKELAK